MTGTPLPWSFADVYAYVFLFIRIIKVRGEGGGIPRGDQSLPWLGLLLGITLAGQYPPAHTYICWSKVTGYTHVVVHVQSGWREQGKHRVGCANTFIILWYPPQTGFTVYNLPLSWWSART